MSQTDSPGEDPETLARKARANPSGSTIPPFGGPAVNFVLRRGGIRPGRRTDGHCGGREKD